MAQSFTLILRKLKILIILVIPESAHNTALSLHPGFVKIYSVVEKLLCHRLDVQAKFGNVLILPIITMGIFTEFNELEFEGDTRPKF